MPDMQIDYTSYPAMIKSLARKYGMLPMDKVAGAFSQTWEGVRRKAWKEN